MFFMGVDVFVYRCNLEDSGDIKSTLFDKFFVYSIETLGKLLHLSSHLAGYVSDRIT